MARHHLIAGSSADPVAVASDVCGVQAQLMSWAQLALRARMPTITRDRIRAALLESKTLVRTLCMRRTLHLLPAAEFSTYMTAVRTSRMAALWRVTRRFGIKEKEIDALNQLVVRELAGGPLSQGELRDRLRPQVGRTVRKWMAAVSSMVSPAITEGLICYGAERGAEATFVRVDRWLPKQRKIAEADAQRCLLRRYLRAYGPATVRDFAFWSGLSMKEARVVWASVQDELIEVATDDGAGWILRDDVADLKNSGFDGEIVRLIPGFDPYLLAHATKDHLVRKAHYKRVYRNQGWITPVVLVNGRVAGIWKSERKGNRLAIEIAGFEKFSKPSREKLAAEAEGLARFLDVKCELTFGSHP